MHILTGGPKWYANELSACYSAAKRYVRWLIGLAGYLPLHSAASSCLQPHMLRDSLGVSLIDTVTTTVCFYLSKPRICLTQTGKISVTFRKLCQRHQLTPPRSLILRSVISARDMRSVGPIRHGLWHGWLFSAPLAVV